MNAARSETVTRASRFVVGGSVCHRRGHEEFVERRVQWRDGGLLGGAQSGVIEQRIKFDPSFDHFQQKGLVVPQRFVAGDVGATQLDEGCADVLMVGSLSLGGTYCVDVMEF